MVNGVSCILDFPKFSGGGPPDPPYKGNTSIKPSKSFFNNKAAKGKKQQSRKTLPHSNSLQEIYLSVIQKLKKGGGRWGHCLSFYFVCDDQIQISCAVWLRKMENLAMTFCYLWLTEKLWLLGDTAPQSPP